MWDMLFKLFFKQGRALSPEEKRTFKPYFAENVIKKTRIIDGSVPFWLRKKMIAVVINNNIYFRPGVYHPNTKQGVALLGHELMHVSQFLHGMNWLKYLWSCRYGYRKNAYEVAAYEKGALIAANYQQVG